MISMIHRKLLIATAIGAAAAITACSDTTAPEQLVQEGFSSAASPRSGTLHVEKECTAYTGQAGDFCTFTSSSLKQIEAGTRIVYAEAAPADGLLDTDVILDPPGPGNNAAFGHCTVNLATGLGRCEFSGGTGKFTWFHASVAVSPLGGLDFVWDGTYSFRPRD
jgi:hypothetical protein